MLTQVSSLTPWVSHVTHGHTEAEVPGSKPTQIHPNCPPNGFPFSPAVRPRFLSPQRCVHGCVAPNDLGSRPSDREAAGMNGFRAMATVGPAAEDGPNVRGGDER